MPSGRPRRANQLDFRPEDLRDASRGERLQRVLADAGVASRRACEALIEAGAVEVNGVVVRELPAWVDPRKDRIIVEGRPLPQSERHVYIMLNKPPRTLSTASDEPGADRRTVLDLVDHPERARLFPVGRLDYDSIGLVLLTNDGELANRITHPRFGVPKTYRVVVKGALDDAAAKELERGIYLAERKAGQTVGAARTAQVELSVVKRDRDRTTLEMTLREGRNRQVRRMLAAVGYPVKSLERTAVGPVRLKGVARGAWRELTSGEIKALRKAAAAPTKKSRDTDGPEASGKASRSSSAARSNPRSSKKAGGNAPNTSKGGKTSPGIADEGEPGAPLPKRAVRDAVYGRKNDEQRGPRRGRSKG